MKNTPEGRGSHLAGAPESGSPTQQHRDANPGSAVPGGVSAAASTARVHVPIKVRPMLVSGMLATDERGPMILINSEEDPEHQVITLWHETLHLLGLKDEFLVEQYAIALAEACPDILRKLAHNINVPDSNAPGAASGETK